VRLRHEITRHGLNESDYPRDDQIADGPETLLRILNEDLLTEVSATRGTGGTQDGTDLIARENFESARA
jgi:hypothetical protein